MKKLMTLLWVSVAGGAGMFSGAILTQKSPLWLKALVISLYAIIINIISIILEMEE